VKFGQTLTLNKLWIGDLPTGQISSWNWHLFSVSFFYIYFHLIIYIYIYIYIYIWWSFSIKEISYESFSWKDAPDKRRIFIYRLARCVYRKCFWHIDNAVADFEFISNVFCGESQRYYQSLVCLHNMLMKLVT